MRTRCVGLLVAATVAGCGTTRVTDTQRAASEMLLVSQAIDNAVGELDFADLRGKAVFLDTQYLDGTVDRGYLVSSLRQHLLAHGARLQEERTAAQYVVEPRSGGVGTDRHSLLVGTPQMSIPQVIVGQPAGQVPEIALARKTNQRAVAKIAVFAYDRTTGRAVWQSGLVEGASFLKDTWVFGTGPYSRGTILSQPRLAGEPLPSLPPLPFTGGKEDPADAAQVPGPPTPTPEVPAPGLQGLLGVAGSAAAGAIPAGRLDPHNPSPTPAVVPAGGENR